MTCMVGELCNRRSVTFGFAMTKLREPQLKIQSIATFHHIQYLQIIFCAAQLEAAFESRECDLTCGFSASVANPLCRQTRETNPSVSEPPIKKIARHLRYTREAKSCRLSISRSSTPLN